jgi:hypothetical protein
MSLGDKDKYFNLIFQTKMDQLFLSEKAGGVFFFFNVIHETHLTLFLHARAIFEMRGCSLGVSFSSRTSALPNTCDLFIYAKTHIKMSDLDDIKEKIRAAMNSQGTYTSDLDLCITLCAGSYIAFKIALNDIAKKKRSFVTEVSREGNKKLVAHPAFKVLFDALEVTRKQLRELGLTLQTLSASDDDEVNDLINEVDKIDRDGEGD